MRRVAAITAVLATAAGLAIFGMGAGDSNGYQVRAIFDDAAFAIQGEDVKIAGVKVGTIDSLDITKDKKAAVVLNITSGGFQDFRTDAHCTIRPQSLIGEKFVECTPTAPHPPGATLPPKLPVIRSGPGKGQHLLPVKNTSSPVDIDEISDIVRAPEQQRLSLIIDEFGTGLAGNGKALSETIRRANPALQETDKVLKILAQQNKVLADLARDSDTVLAPLAAQRQQVADFVVKANTVNQAAAERSAALRANLQLLPRFLTELRPTLTRVSGLSDEMVPLLQDLHGQAPAINRLIEQLGPFSQAARPAVRSLGRAAAVGTPAVKAFDPIVNQLDQFTRAAKPVADNLSAILTSLRDTGGVERIMDYAFFQVASINGFDALGHYLRAGLIVNLCATYAVTPVTGCSANFAKPGQESGSSGSAASARPSAVAREQAVAAAGNDKTLQRTAKVLGGEKPQHVYADEARARLRAARARQERTRKATAKRKLGAARAKPARAKLNEQRAVLRARRLCHRIDTAPTKARCARARRRARVLARLRLQLGKAAFKQAGPIQLPTLQLPGGLGAGALPPLQTPPDSLATRSTQAPVADQSGAAPDGSGGGAPTAQRDPKQGLFDYLLGS
jgi:phospholipid/cholesterol/gamma-HCH transport system substrate-binding protein